MKILLIGGSGMLGTELLKINPNIIHPTRKGLDIAKGDAGFYIGQTNPDIVILAAAVTDNREVEKNPTKALDVNIIGSTNVAIACMARGIRLIYISTDYVYPGDHGNYRESDPLQPFNLYAWTKLGGECAVKAVPNHLIIRTSFGKNEFPYKQAFIDKWTSKDYVDKIAPLIYEAALSPLTGVVNIGTERKTLYAHAIERAKDSITPIKISESSFNTPYDTSLNLQKWMDYESSESIVKPHLECRVCGSKDMSKYLDLGLMPMANNLEFTAASAKEKERYPLQVLFCNNCALSQLSVVINPEKMFSNYVYRSSVNGGYIKHCEAMAKTLVCSDYGIRAGIGGTECFHIDIAGNDGALLRVFKEMFRHQVLNVDPASNLTAIAEQSGIPSRTDFWSTDLAHTIVERFGRWATLITATNVFAHLDHIHDFLKGCKIALEPNGILVIENPYLIDFIENMEFDTVYHEHVTYWSLIPMLSACYDNGLKVIDVEKQNIHGGTMRYVIAQIDSGHEISQRVEDLEKLERSKGYDKFETYASWSDQVKVSIDEFGRELLKLKKAGNTIAAFAASAKGATLLCSARITTDIVDYIADQTPEKIGKFQPGTGIPIVGIEMIEKAKPDYIVILSWNFQAEIIGKIKAIGYKGKYIVPIPNFRIID